MIDNTEATEPAVTEADVRKYEAEIATLRAVEAALLRCERRWLGWLEE